MGARRRGVALVTGAVVAAGAAAAVAAPADAAPAPRLVRAADYSAFVTPSGNITCMFLQGSVRCDIVNRTYRTPRRPASCPLAYGNAFLLGKRASIGCVGDTVLGTAATGTAQTRWLSARNGVVVPTAMGRAAGLRYGWRMSNRGITCASTTAGVTCTNAAKRGFTLAKTGYRLF